MIEQLITILGSELDLNPTEVADLLWLTLERQKRIQTQPSPPTPSPDTKTQTPSPPPIEQPIETPSPPTINPPTPAITPPPLASIQPLKPAPLAPLSQTISLYPFPMLVLCANPSTLFAPSNPYCETSPPPPNR